MPNAAAPAFVPSFALPPAPPAAPPLSPLVNGAAAVVTLSSAAVSLHGHAALAEDGCDCVDLVAQGDVNVRTAGYVVVDQELASVQLTFEVFVNEASGYYGLGMMLFNAAELSALDAADQFTNWESQPGGSVPRRQEGDAGAQAGVGGGRGAAAGQPRGSRSRAFERSDG